MADHPLVQEYYAGQPFNAESAKDIELVATEAVIDGQRELVYRTGLRAQKNDPAGVVLVAKTVKLALPRHFENIDAQERIHGKATPQA